MIAKAHIKIEQGKRPLRSHNRAESNSRMARLRHDNAARALEIRMQVLRSRAFRSDQQRFRTK